MDPEFQNELRSLNIPEDLVTWMGVHCPTPARFAYFIDEKTEMQQYIVDMVPATKGNRTVRSALVELWKRHLACQERKLSRQAAGVAEAD